MPASAFKEYERDSCEHLIGLFERGEGVEWYREKHLKHAALTQIAQAAYAVHQGTCEREDMQMKEVRSANDYAGRTVLLSDYYRRLWPSNPSEAKEGLTMYDELERHFSKGIGLKVRARLQPHGWSTRALILLLSASLSLPVPAFIGP